jgi:hypothetical protein
MAHVMFCPLEYKRIRKVIVKNETQKRQILIVTKTLKTFKSLSDGYSMTLKFNSTKKRSQYPCLESKIIGHYLLKNGV